MVPRLVWLSYMAASHQYFRKAPQPTSFQLLLQQHLGLELLRCLLTLEHLLHLHPLLRFLKAEL